MQAFLLSLESDLTACDWWSGEWLFRRWQDAQVYVTKQQWSSQAGSLVAIGIADFAPEQVFGNASPPSLFVWSRDRRLAAKLGGEIEKLADHLGEVDHGRSGWIVKMTVAKCLPEQLVEYFPEIRTRFVSFVTHYVGVIDRLDGVIRGHHSERLMDEVSRGDAGTRVRVEHCLPDLLQPRLKVVFCGTAAGRRSAARKAYYAGHGNRFWAVLHEVGLTPRQLEPSAYQELLRYGLGLTDLAKHVSGPDSAVSSSALDVTGFRKRIREAKPEVVAFNGKRAAEACLGRPVSYGLQAELLEEARVFVLPSTSALAGRYWDVGIWRRLAESANGERGY